MTHLMANENEISQRTRKQNCGYAPPYGQRKRNGGYDPIIATTTKNDYETKVVP